MNIRVAQVIKSLRGPLSAGKQLRMIDDNVRE